MPPCAYGRFTSLGVHPSTPCLPDAASVRWWTPCFHHGDHDTPLGGPSLTVPTSKSCLQHTPQCVHADTISLWIWSHRNQKTFTEHHTSLPHHRHVLEVVKRALNMNNRPIDLYRGNPPPVATLTQGVVLLLCDICEVNEYGRACQPNRV